MPEMSSSQSSTAPSQSPSITVTTVSLTSVPARRVVNMYVPAAGAVQRNATSSAPPGPEHEVKSSPAPTVST